MITAACGCVSLCRVNLPDVVRVRLRMETGESYYNIVTFATFHHFQIENLRVMDKFS